MNLINATRMTAGYAMGLEPSGRELLVIAVKGTFRIPGQMGARLALDEMQAPLTMADEFFGEAGQSAPKYEVDFAPRKRRCDVLLNGSAYAPGGHPTERVTVGLQIGNWSKSFAVVGDRAWFASGVRCASVPARFMTMPVSYDRAFGGADLRHEDPSQHAAFMANPSGRGFHKHLQADWLDGTPLPNTEELGTPVTEPDGSYRPMSFGIVARHWEPRVRYAGTYDKHWQDEVLPFLPSDFSDEYFQAAPADQQLRLPIGEQAVRLLNLTPGGICAFVLPHFEAPIQIFPKKGPREELSAVADTIVIEPDLQRVMVTWRVARPLRRNMFEIAEVLVGRKGPDWWQKRAPRSFPIAIVAEQPGEMLFAELEEEADSGLEELGFADGDEPEQVSEPDDIRESTEPYNTEEDG